MFPFNAMRKRKLALQWTAWTLPVGSIRIHRTPASLIYLISVTSYFQKRPRIVWGCCTDTNIIPTGALPASANGVNIVLPFIIIHQPRTIINGREQSTAPLPCLRRYILPHHLTTPRIFEARAFTPTISLWSLQRRHKLLRMALIIEIACRWLRSA